LKYVLEFAQNSNNNEILSISQKNFKAILDDEQLGSRNFVQGSASKRTSLQGFLHKNTKNAIRSSKIVGNTCFFTIKLFKILKISKILHGVQI